jgi:signal transduction histidine kinase
LRRLPIRTKLAVALAVPLLALIAVTVLEVVKTSSEVDDIGAQTELARSAIGPSGIITALQNERTWLAVELIGSAGQVTVPVEGYEQTRAETDEAISAFRDDMERRSDTVTDVYSEPLAGLDALATVRRDIDASTLPRDPNNIEFAGQIFDRYTELIAPFFSATTRISLAVDDPTLRQGTELADAVAREIETMSVLLRTMIVDATLTPGGIDQSAEVARLASLHSDFQHYAEVLSNATGPYSRLASDHYPEDLENSVDEQVTAALSTGRIDLATVLAAVNVPREEAFTGYQDSLHGLINDRADDLQSSAEVRRVWFGVLAALALGVAVVLTWLVSRSITRPLRSLTKQAKEMAEHRLPDAVLDILETPLGDDVDVPQITPVNVRTRDEVSDVADALNTVQDSALDLAVEQAVLRRNIADSFVNLGRRNQNLLGRQLDFITELESNETDPDTLASLFRLDHLATRMRRNAESLLVLAGIEPPRKWAAPVRLTDVIRAALGEVEDYQRATIRGVEPATILGSAAADLAHLIAEFMENALTFSPPDQNVEVRGRHNHDGGYSLAVIDAGFGMPAADIAQANRRLAGTESFTIAPSKYLGHYVAGNLAARHGIHLQLDNSPGSGITATIDLPPGLLTSEAPTGDPITDPHGNRVIAARVAEAAEAARGEVAGDGTEVGPAAAASAAPGGFAGQPAQGPGPAPAWADPGRGGPGAPGGPAGPSGPGPSGPGGLGGPRPSAPPAEPMRTASGLVKRSSRSEQPTGRTAAAVPSGDLLAALSSHTNRLGGQPQPGRPGEPGGTPDRAGTLDRPALPSRPGAGDRSGSIDRPALPSRPSGRTGPGSWPPADAPRFEPNVSARPGRFTPGEPSGPPAWDFLANPPGPANPPIPPSPAAERAPSPANPPSPPSPVRPASLAGPPAERAGPPPAPRLDPGSGGTTSSGLARRVRGAQMPTTQPVSLRRGGDGGSAGTGGNGGSAPGDPARDVYGFLSNFTAGVQRGLDEARHSTEPPPDDR